MFLFFTDQIHNQTLILLGDEHQHCATVLRKKIGDQLFITDGKGQIFNAEITNIAKNQTECSIMSVEVKAPHSPAIAIAIAPTKNASRIEWFVEKAMEIGINAIYLITTARTEKKNINISRLQKISIAAMKQSLNVHLPDIIVFDKMKDFYTYVAAQYEQKYIAHCDHHDLMLPTSVQKSTILMIGPEGDFTSKEISEAYQYSYQSVSLGSSRLRTETAGLVGLIRMK